MRRVSCSWLSTVAVAAAVSGASSSRTSSGGGNFSAVRHVTFDINKRAEPLEAAALGRKGQEGQQRKSVEEDVIPQLPKMDQTIPGLSYSMSDEYDKRIPSLSAAGPDKHRTEEEKQQVANWQPVVRGLPDERVRVGLVGRMNAGKSSLFNYFVPESDYRPTNLVKNMEGVTKDCIEGIAKIGDMYCTLVDTPGATNNTLVEEAMRIVQTADVLVFVTAIDGELTIDERKVIEMIHRRSIPCILVVNKMDIVTDSGMAGLDKRDELLQSYTELGLGAPIPFSVWQGEGQDLLAEALRPFHELSIMEKRIRDWNMEDLAMEGDPESMERIRERNLDESAIRIAILGKPNAGKSTIFNRLLGFERSRVTEEENTTRDPIEYSCMYRGRKIILIDTAGIYQFEDQRDNPVRHEYYLRTKRVLDYCHIAIIAFDAREGVPSFNERFLMRAAHQEGRPAVFAANKWDGVLDPQATAEAIDFRVKRSVYEQKYSSAVVCSAATGLNMTLLLDECIALYDRWNKHIHAKDLTRFWKRFERTVNIPTKRGRVMQIKQVNVRPPAFRLYLQTKDPKGVLQHQYQEMVRNAIIEEYGFRGTPVRILQEVSTNHKDWI